MSMKCRATFLQSLRLVQTTQEELIFASVCSSMFIYLPNPTQTQIHFTLQKSNFVLKLGRMLRKHPVHLKMRQRQLKTQISIIESSPSASSPILDDFVNTSSNSFLSQKFKNMTKTNHLHNIDTQHKHIFFFITKKKLFSCNCSIIINQL